MEHTEERTVAGPADEVWAVLVDVERWPSWTRSMDDVQLLTDGPLAVGSRARVKQPGFPAAVWEVTELRPGESFTWESVAPGVRSRGRHDLRPLDSERCQVRLTIEQTGPLAPLLVLLFGRRSRGYVAMEADGLAGRFG